MKIKQFLNSKWYFMRVLRLQQQSAGKVRVPGSAAGVAGAGVQGSPAPGAWEPLQVGRVRGARQECGR